MEDDTVVLATTTATVYTFGLALAASALPQTIAAGISTSLLLSVDLLTNRPPEPFERLSVAWKDYGKALEDYHSDVKALVKKVDEAWEGPGADAFVKYMEEQFLPPLKLVAEACQTAETACDSIAKNFQEGLEFFFDSTCSCIIVMIASNALMAVPKVGWALAEIAKCAAAFFEGYVLLKNYLNIADSLKQDMSMSKDLQYAANDLYMTFTDDENSIGKGVLTKEYKASESKMEDPKQWNKE
jgi:hypothetical protein